MATVFPDSFDFDLYYENLDEFQQKSFVDRITECRQSLKVRNAWKAQFSSTFY